jgi:hypothetical protein
MGITGEFEDEEKRPEAPIARARVHTEQVVDRAISELVDGLDEDWADKAEEVFARGERGKPKMRPVPPEVQWLHGADNTSEHFYNACLIVSRAVAEAALKKFAQRLEVHLEARLARIEERLEYIEGFLVLEKPNPKTTGRQGPPPL